MKKIKIVLGLGICLYAINLFAEITNDDWVRVYDHQVLDLYTITDTSKNKESPLSLNEVIVVLNPQINNKDETYNTKDRFSPILLSNFQTMVQSKKGCLYSTYSDFPDGKYNKNGCEIVQRTKNIDEDYAKCRQLGRSNSFFVSFDLSETQCLNGLRNLKSEYLINPVIKPSDKEGYVIVSWSGFDNGYKKIAYPDNKNYYGRERQGIRNYYDSYQNKILGCQDYGQPFSRLTKEMPQDYFIKNKSFYFAENDPYDHVALWQKQYLIKTKGFYDRNLWEAWRVIDEPIHIGLNLNDGTVLLIGVSSILRVRYEDGETKAPESIVKMRDPSEIRAHFDKHGGFVECDADRIMRGICNLDTAPNYQEGQKMSEKQFNKAVIEGTDKIIQEYFEQGDK